MTLPVVIPSESAITSRSSHFGDLRRAQNADESRDLLLPLRVPHPSRFGFVRRVGTAFVAQGAPPFLRGPWGIFRRYILADDVGLKESEAQ
jgi:hypothetical protein